MADYNARVLPFINTFCTVTAEAGIYPSGGYHSGIDISTGKNDPVYSICNGKVIFAGQERDSSYNLVGYGNYIIIKDDDSDYAFLFAHLKDFPLKRTGDLVKVGEQFGIEGTTGNSTGIHLHVEMENYVSNGNRWIYDSQDPSKWNVVYFPASNYMGFPNELGARIYYNGVPIPYKRRNSMKWLKSKAKKFLINY